MQSYNKEQTLGEERTSRKGATASANNVGRCVKERGGRVGAVEVDESNIKRWREMTNNEKEVNGS
jgi:hypothetical protein